MIIAASQGLTLRGFSMFQHHPKLFLSEVCQWSHSVLGNAKAVSALIEQKARRRPNLQSYDFAQLYMYSLYSSK